LFALAFASIGLLLIYKIGNLPGNLEYTGFFLPVIVVSILTSMKVHIGTWMSATCNYLGRISYSVYLAQFGSVPLFKKLLEGYPTELQWLFFVSSNLAFALTVYHFIEAPLHKPVKEFLGKILSKRTLLVGRATS
jgi:peptidoglycan/LPS O-acetylase OafA/YrhL